MSPDDLRRVIFDMTGDDDQAREAAARRALERMRENNFKQQAD